MYWLVDGITAVRFGEPEIEDGAYSLLKNGPLGYKAIFDSGTSMTMIPKEIFDPFITKLRKHTARSAHMHLDPRTGMY